MIVLSYALSRFTSIPSQTFGLQLPGVYFTLEFSDNILTAILVAALSAAGAGWLLRDHPLSRDVSLIPHIILPAIVALMIGIPLNQLPFGISWWIGLLTGTSLMILVVLGEYIALDSQDTRQPLASAGLTAVGFAVYLIIATALRASGARLYITLPAIGIMTWLLSLRAMNLRLQGIWTVYEAALIGLIICQISAALHYWPLTPVRFGLLLVGPVYALTSLFCGLIEEKPVKELVLEPLVVIGASWTGAVLLA
jgi:hypothetical protein